MDTHLVSGGKYSSNTSCQVFFKNIPDELKNYHQWVNWKLVSRNEGGKPTKPPYQSTGKLAETNNPATWTDFETAKEAACCFSGVGFVLTKDDPFVALDFDNCRCPAFDFLDTEISSGHNLVLPSVRNLISNLNSYTEVSPSGKGIRIFLRGKLPVDGRKKGDFEVYQSGRYVTITGHVIDGFPSTIEARQVELSAFYQAVFGLPEKTTKQETISKVPPDTPIADWREVLELAFENTGGSLKHLYSGNHSAYPSHSEADFDLCSCLASLFDGDKAAIDSAFRSSGLMREKWDEKHFSDGRTYGQATIEKAISKFQSLNTCSYTEPSPSATEADGPPSVTWPSPLDRAAYWGLVGEWIERVLPNTESDPAALLFQFLVAFGNVTGRRAYFKVEATEHHTNENLLLIGDTSKGRKGTSWDHVRQIYKVVDSSWELDCIKSGLASGEGLIYHVRDVQIEKKKGKDTDLGVSDKRLVVYESEFANVLKIIERKDNTLSAQIRDAWDRGNLRTLAKNSPIKATGAHISIVSHITKSELTARLSANESFNGFANRFVFACVKRSKLLPEGGGSVDLSGIIPRLKRAIEFARDVGEMKRDEEAREAWRNVYEYLTCDQPGILGGVLAREAPHVVRLSMVYALLDCSKLIRKEHLMAAWESAVRKEINQCCLDGKEHD